MPVKPLLLTLATVVLAVAIGLGSATADRKPAQRYAPIGCGWYGHVDPDTGLCLGQRQP